MLFVYVVHAPRTRSELEHFCKPDFFCSCRWFFILYLFIMDGWMDDIRQITFTFITAGPIFFLFFVLTNSSCCHYLCFFFVLFFLMKNSSCSTTDKTVFYTHTHMHAYTNTYPNRFNEKKEKKNVRGQTHHTRCSRDTHTHTHKTIISTRRRFLLVVSGHDEQLFSQIFHSIQFGRFFFWWKSSKTWCWWWEKGKWKNACVCVYGVNSHISVVVDLSYIFFVIVVETKQNVETRLWD